MDADSWAITAVPEEADKTLDAWSVYEVTLGAEPGVRTRHVAGFAREGCKVRVSTAIVALDPSTRRCRTQSGRVYCLAGRPGLSADVLAVWGVFKRVNRITAERDVTSEIEHVLAASGLPPSTSDTDFVGIAAGMAPTEPKVSSVVSAALARLAVTSPACADTDDGWGSLFGADSDEVS